MDSCCSFSHTLRSCQHYYLGNEHKDKPSVPNTSFIKTCCRFFDAIAVFPIFIVEERSGCFAISDQPIFRVVPTPNGLEIPSPTSYYHIGVRLVLGPFV